MTYNCSISWKLKHLNVFFYVFYVRNDAKVFIPYIFKVSLKQYQNGFALLQNGRKYSWDP